MFVTLYLSRKTLNLKLQRIFFLLLLLLHRRKNFTPITFTQLL